jgi:hypothetical protein
VPNINDSFPSAYIKASDLQGRSVIVTINRVEFEPVGQKREMKPILYFDGKDKGLVLNKTNANKIISITGSTLTEDWAGQSIIIYPTETSFQGDTVECVRVKSAPANGRRTVPAPMPVQEDAPELTDDDIPF